MDGDIDALAEEDCFNEFVKINNVTFSFQDNINQFIELRKRVESIQVNQKIEATFNIHNTKKDRKTFSINCTVTSDEKGKIEIDKFGSSFEPLNAYESKVSLSFFSFYLKKKTPYYFFCKIREEDHEISYDKKDYILSSISDLEFLKIGITQNSNGPYRVAAYFKNYSMKNTIEDFSYRCSLLDLENNLAEINVIEGIIPQIKLNQYPIESSILLKEDLTLSEKKIKFNCNFSYLTSDILQQMTQEYNFAL